MLKLSLQTFSYNSISIGTIDKSRQTKQTRIKITSNKNGRIWHGAMGKPSRRILVRAASEQRVCGVCVFLASLGFIQRALFWMSLFRQIEEVDEEEGCP